MKTTFPDLFRYRRPSNRFSRVDRVFLRHIAKKKIFRPAQKIFFIFAGIEGTRFLVTTNFFFQKTWKKPQIRKTTFSTHYRPQKNHFFSLKCSYELFTHFGEKKISLSKVTPSPHICDLKIWHSALD